jgi:rhodanese-related sulfurtransferase
MTLHIATQPDSGSAELILSVGSAEPQLGSRLANAWFVSTDNLHEQFDHQFSVAVVDADVFATSPERLRTAFHLAVQHLAPGGHLVVTGTACCMSLVNEFELVPVEGPERLGFASSEAVVLRRTERFTVHDMLFEARALIERIDPIELEHRCSSPEPPIVVDTRAHVDRRRFGVIPGAIHVPRTVLEWHLDPANGYRHPSVASLAQPLVIVCNGGYSSSLAAASLQRLGYESVADLIGGHLAWRAAGLPVEPADHSHLDL